MVSRSLRPCAPSPLLLVVTLVIATACATHVHAQCTPRGASDDAVRVYAQSGANGTVFYEHCTANSYPPGAYYEKYTCSNGTWVDNGGWTTGDNSGQPASSTLYCPYPCPDPPANPYPAHPEAMTTSCPGAGPYAGGSTCDWTCSTNYATSLKMDGQDNYFPTSYNFDRVTYYCNGTFHQTGGSASPSCIPTCATRKPASGSQQVRWYAEFGIEGTTFNEVCGNDNMGKSLATSVTNNELYNCSGGVWQAVNKSRDGPDLLQCPIGAAKSPYDCFTGEAVAHALWSPRFADLLAAETQRAAAEKNGSMQPRPDGPASARVAALEHALQQAYELQLPRALVDPVVPCEASVCTLRLLPVAIKFLQMADCMLTHSAAGEVMLEPIVMLAHQFEWAPSVDIITLEYERPDGEVAVLKLTPDHMLNVLPRVKAHGAAVVPAGGRVFEYITTGAVDFNGDRGLLSMAHLMSARDIQVGDQLWHQPLPAAGSVHTGALPPLVSVPVVRVSRAREGALLDNPNVREWRLLLDGLVASNHIDSMLGTYYAMHWVCAPLFWWYGDYAGRTVIRAAFMAAYDSFVGLNQPGSQESIGATIAIVSALPIILAMLTVVATAITAHAVSKCCTKTKQPAAVPSR